ncbi:hypothetical protein MYU51_009687 [Penicillium brevicompactum]|uniref:uncharacterized protein n=1 Tax=Penicillium brevicompactum TaxID=5074 RepID=UPI002541CD19|nr:uncharacterized protein N7506_000967 [Penicillium brevicompactum]KAJ5347714.1 hypothetical protein N7506_000967 [Penicillium brevicompactum]
MPAKGDAFSFSKPACASEAAWDATDATMQTQQPTGPKPPSVDQVIAENSSEEHTMKLRGGGAGDVCCGMCAGLLCFECCEECC